MNNDIKRQGCSKPEDSRSAVLMRAARTGDYPPGITANDLAEVREPVRQCTIEHFNGTISFRPEGGETALHYAAQFGKLPAGTTVKILASAVDACGRSALEVAAQYNNLPPGTSAKELAAIWRKDGYSELHVAVRYGRFPPDTTLELLQSTKGTLDATALSVAVDWGHLPPGTTIHDLATSKWEDGSPLLDRILGKIQNLDDRHVEDNKRLLRQVRELLRASAQSEKANVESQEQLERLITIFSKLDRVQAADWAAKELAKSPPKPREPSKITR